MANGATIEVLYFGRIAELTGQRSETWAWPATDSGRGLLDRVRVRHPALAQSAKLKLAINQAHAPADTLISAGDEVAVFEPVTGG